MKKTQKMAAFYAVAAGKAPGIYRTWAECKAAVDGAKGARFKKFATESEAAAFIRSFGSASVLSQLGVTAEEPEATAEAEDDFVCFTDGACSKNGRTGAKAAFAVVWPWHPEANRSGRVPGEVQSNNRAEFLAAIVALEEAARMDPTGRRTLTVYTDSDLLVNCMRRWIAGWKRAGWRKADGGPVANLDLVQRLSELADGRRGKVTWIHVPAHTGGADWRSRWNDAADKAAVAALEGGK